MFGACIPLSQILEFQKSLRIDSTRAHAKTIKPLISISLFSYSKLQKHIINNKYQEKKNHTTFTFSFSHYRNISYTKPKTNLFGGHLGSGNSERPADSRLADPAQTKGAHCQIPATGGYVWVGTVAPTTSWGSF